jgi:hypothetical protein
MLAAMISEYGNLRGSTGLQQVNRRYAVVGSVVRIVRGTGRVTLPVVAALAQVLEDGDSNIATIGAQGLSAAADAHPYVTASAEPALRRAVDHPAMGHLAARTLDKLVAAHDRPVVIYMHPSAAAMEAVRSTAPVEEAFHIVIDDMMRFAASRTMSGRNST